MADLMVSWERRRAGVLSDAALLEATDDTWRAVGVWRMEGGSAALCFPLVAAAVTRHYVVPCRPSAGIAPRAAAKAAHAPRSWTWRRSIGPRQLRIVVRFRRPAVYKTAVGQHSVGTAPFGVVIDVFILSVKRGLRAVERIDCAAVRRLAFVPFVVGWGWYLRQSVEACLYLRSAPPPTEHDERDNATDLKYDADHGYHQPRVAAVIV